MKIESVELRELAVDLKFRFETSFGVERDLHKVLLVLRSGGLVGYGEVTANRVPGYSYETASVAWTALEEFILPRVVGKEFSTPAQLLHAVSGIRGHNMAVAALEMAFWDLQAKAAGVPLWQLLGGVRESIAVGASLGIQPSAQATVAEAERHVAEGYKRLKFKIKPGWDVVPLRAVRAALPDTALTVDANSAYRLTDARVFHELDELGLDYIEQPLAHDDLVDHAKLQSLLLTPICLDESVHSAADARKGLALDSGRVINVKLGRVRGHLEARRVHDVALAFGAPVWCGGMLELGVGRAHNLHMSTLENYTLPGDTSSASRYWGDEDVIEERLDAVAGVQRLPTTGPGLGVTLREDLVERFTVRRHLAAS
ncbi:MAG TPA: o-succinylbenzoate synthase [Trueperaceae bacterium]|nr:o-succinylbenzoate synthase [Trueperaceae bacterium]